MNTADIVAKIAENMGLPKVTTRNLLNAALDQLAEDLEKGKSVVIPGLGTFGTRKRERMKSYNPQTERLSLLPPRIKIFFRPGKILKNQVKDKGHG